MGPKAGNFLQKGIILKSGTISPGVTGPSSTDHRQRPCARRTLTAPVHHLDPSTDTMPRSRRRSTSRRRQHAGVARSPSVGSPRPRRSPRTRQSRPSSPVRGDVLARYGMRSMHSLHKEIRAIITSDLARLPEVQKVRESSGWREWALDRPSHPLWWALRLPPPSILWHGIADQRQSRCAAQPGQCSGERSLADGPPEFTSAGSGEQV